MSNGINEEKLDHIAACFRSRYGLLISIARKYVPVSDLACDVIQQTFVEILEKSRKDEIKPDADLTPLLCNMVKNKAIALWREQQRRSPEVVREIGEHFMQIARQRNSVSPEPDIRLELLRQCVDKLPLRSWRVVQRHYSQGESFEQIAKTEKTKAGTLRQLFFRIRRQLRKCVEKHLAPTSDGEESRRKRS